MLTASRSLIPKNNLTGLLLGRQVRTNIKTGTLYFLIIFANLENLFKELIFNQMDNLIKPHIIQFPRIGNTGLGYISVAEKGLLPIQVNRVYWTYFTPEDVQRGGHAHYHLQQVLLAVAGKIIITTELINGEKEKFILDKPDQGLFIPKMCWREMQYTHNAVQVCLASLTYDEKDYIRDYKKFKSII
jgi:hypothetical protein